MVKYVRDVINESPLGRPLLALLVVGLFLAIPVSASAQNRTWVYFSGDDPAQCSGGCVTTFIDPFSKTSYGFEKIGMTTLTEYDDASQSAQTFGFSEVQHVIFDCMNSRIQYGKTVWYADKQARGKITKEFKASTSWVPIQRAYIPLFAKLCSS